ncbi:MAG: hypothetical protein ACM336_03220 [Acidobacteriota bacterium]
MHRLCATLLACSAGLLSGQITGPVTGFLYHSPTKSIRAISGVPGSAVLASPLIENVEFGSVSPDGKWALVRGADFTAIVKPGTVVSGEQRPAGLIPEIDAAAWSGSRLAVVVASSSAKVYQRVRLSGTRWVADAPRSFASLPGSLTSISADTTGAQVALGLTAGAQGSIYLAVNGAAPAFVMSGPVAAVAAFAPRGGTFYAAVSAPGVIEVFEGAARVGSLAFAAEDGSAPEAAALAVSADGKRLYATAKEKRALWSIDLATSQAAVTPLDEVPNALLPVGPRSWLLLNSPAKNSEPAVLASDSEQPVTTFVPALEGERSSL